MRVVWRVGDVASGQVSPMIASAKALAATLRDDKNFSGSGIVRRATASLQRAMI
jgi:hypothetical protein